MNEIISQPKLKAAELNLGGTATTEKVFQDVAGLPIVLPLPAAGQLAGTQGPAVSRMAKIRIRAHGRVTGGGTTNYTPQLQYGVSATASENTDLESGAAVAVNSVSGFWFLEAELWIDDESGKMGGFVRHGVSGSTVTVADWSVVDNNISGLDPDGGGTLGFVVTGTFSGGFAGNKAYLDHFSLSKEA